MRPLIFLLLPLLPSTGIEARRRKRTPPADAQNDTAATPRRYENKEGFDKHLKGTAVQEMMTALKGDDGEVIKSMTLVQTQVGDKAGFSRL